LCAEGDGLAEGGKYDEAVAKYNEAWKLIPKRATGWNASTWVLAAIAEALEYAMHCPGAVGNSLLHLRLGQCYFEKERSIWQLMNWLERTWPREVRFSSTTIRSTLRS
jgi:hypothetical protein